MTSPIALPKNSNSKNDSPFESWYAENEFLKSKKLPDEKLEIIKARRFKHMVKSGVPKKEIEQYFGFINPDLTYAKKVLEAQGFLGHIKAGLQDSSMGALVGAISDGNARPSTVMSDKSDIVDKTGHAIGSLVGDIAPSAVGYGMGMLPGAIAGGAIGSAIPVIGTGLGAVIGGAMGAGASAAGTPAFIKQMLTYYYNTGDVDNPSDWVHHVLYPTLKASGIGALTGGLVGKLFGTQIASKLGKTMGRGAITGGEIIAADVLANALEGELPSLDNMIAGLFGAGAMVGTVKTGGYVYRRMAPKALQKVQETWVKKDVKPEQIVEDALTDPSIAQDLIDPTHDGPPRKYGPNKEFISKETTGELPPAPDKDTAHPEKKLTPLEEAENKVLSRVHKGDTAPEVKLTFKDRWNTFYTNAVDKYHPIKVLTDDLKLDIPQDHNPYHSARLMAGSAGKAKHFYEHGVVDFHTNNIVSEGLNNILEKFKTPEDLKSFLAYGMAKRNIELSERITSIPTKKEVKRILKKEIRDIEKKYKPLTKKELGQLSDARFKKLKPEERKELVSKEIQKLSETKNRLKAQSDWELKNIALKRIKADIQKTAAREAKEYKTQAIKKEIKETIDRGVIENTKIGIDKGIDLEASKAVVNAHAHKYGETFAKLVEFQNATLKYLQDAGVISEQQYKDMVAMGEAYLPLKVAETELATNRYSNTALKKIKGSKKLIEDPFKVIYDTTASRIKMAEANNVKRQILEAVNEVPDQQIIKRVIDFDGHRSLRSNEFGYFNDGKYEVYQTSRPELLNAINLLGGDPNSIRMLIKASEQGKLYELASDITALKKMYISISPDFITRNFFRDYFTAAIVLGPAMLNPKLVKDAFKSLRTKDQYYKDRLLAGSARNSLLDLEKHYLKYDIVDVDKKTGFRNNVWNAIAYPIKKSKHNLEALGALSEELTRHMVFINQRRKGKTIKEAGFAARDTTIDFQRMGAKVSALNGIIAYFNATIQGLDKTLRSLKDDPKTTIPMLTALITIPELLNWYAYKDDIRYQEIADWQKDLFFIYIFDSWEPTQDIPETVLNTVGFKLSDHIPEGHSLDHYRINDKGIVEYNRGRTMRIPKPIEFGLFFGALPRRIAEAHRTDMETGLNGYLNSLIESANPFGIPDALLPFIEGMANKNFFTDTQLIPKSIENVLPEYKHTPYTSEVAKIVSQALSWVPVAGDSIMLSGPGIDNIIQSWTGNTGMALVYFTDQALVKSGMIDKVFGRPAVHWTELPIVRAFFIRGPHPHSKSIEMFDKKNKELTKYTNTLKLLTNRMDVKGLEEFIENPEVVSKLYDLQGVQDAIDNIRHVIYAVSILPDDGTEHSMNADEKRQLVDTLIRGQILIAREGLKVMKFLKQNEKDMKTLEKIGDKLGEQQ